jgi:hypothetical protein
MEFKENPNFGKLFSNPIKNKPTSPDYSGKLMVDVRSLNVVDGLAEISLVGWKKQSKTGSTFLSLMVSKPKEDAQPKPTYQTRTPAKNLEEMDDDIPF